MCLLWFGWLVSLVWLVSLDWFGLVWLIGLDWLVWFASFCFLWFVLVRLVGLFELVGRLIGRSFDWLVKFSLAFAKCTCSPPAAVFSRKLVVALDFMM